MEETKNKVIEILKKYTFNKEVWQNYSDNSDLVKDLKINSARIVDIILDIEEQFSIEVKNEVIEKVATIGDLIREIELLK
jgi:acyl carrier protein